MLCEFIVQNFKSYRDETVFDMQAANIEEFADTLIPGPGQNFSSLLPVSAIYGPNGGGKSNLFEALSFLLSLVMRPIATSRNIGNPFGMFYAGEAQPFRLDDQSEDQPINFGITFRTDLAEYSYQISIKNGQILEESLYRVKVPCKRKRDALLFVREGDTITVGTSLNRANTRDVNSSIPYLSFLGINYNFLEIMDVVQWFSNCCIINYSFLASDQRLSTFLDEAEIKKQTLHLLQVMDIPIVDYDFQELTTTDGKKLTQMETVHRLHGKEYKLSIEDESDGTCKILSIMPALLTTLAKGGVLLVDELDSKLHPQLLRFLIKLYADPEINTFHSQLIFTCHDISIMKNEIFRRDEIWFAARDEESVSRIWSLYEIRDEKGTPVKNTAAYDKQYLEGRYGADPYLRRMLDWGARNG